MGGQFKTKEAVVHLCPREKEELSIYTGAYRIAYVRNTLHLSHRRIERLYYESESHRQLINRAFSKIKEVDTGNWHKAFKFLLGLRPRDFDILSGLFEDSETILELIDLISMDMEAGWKSKV